MEKAQAININDLCVAERGYNPKSNLWTAASNGDIKRVVELLDGGTVTANQKDEHGYSCMHAGASYGHIDLLTVLLARGANVNLTDDDGDTPLHSCEDIKTAEFLLEHKADIMQKNSDGQHVLTKLLKDSLEDQQAGEPVNPQRKELISYLLGIIKNTQRPQQDTTTDLAIGAIVEEEEDETEAEEKH